MKINCFHKIFNSNLTKLVYLDAPKGTPTTSRTVDNKEELRVKQLLLSLTNNLKNTLLKIPGADSFKSIKIDFNGTDYLFFLSKEENKISFMSIPKKEPVLNKSGNRTGRVFNIVEAYNFNLTTCKYLGGKASRIEENEVGFIDKTITQLKPKFEEKQLAQLLADLLPVLQRKVINQR